MGYVGSQGVIGYTGSQGVIGFTGSQGVIGYTGSKGDKGDQGYTGSQGDIGYTGSQGVIGFTGSKGYTGSQGIQGEQGYTGSRGDVGYTGSKGDIGYTGSKGDIGYTGSKGDTGYVGSQGIQGYTGSQGDIGYTGSLGYTGSEGYVGSRGNLQITTSATPPGGAVEGDIWIDSNSGIQYFYSFDGDSFQWVEYGNLGVTGYTGSAGTGINMPATSNVNIDASNSNVKTLAQYDTVTFSNFSGTILVNDILDGIMYEFLVGGGKVWILGSTNGSWTPSTSSPTTAAIVTGYVSVDFTGGNYRFTNLASSRNYNFFTVKTRNTA